MNAESTNIRMGMRTVCLPTRATIFLENRSRVPFWEAMPNRKVTPTRVTNMELEKPLVTAEAFRPPTMVRINATPRDRKPRLTFLIKPMATTMTSTTRDTTGI